MATLQKLLQMDPKDVFSHYALGLEHLEQNAAEAERCFLRVLELDTQYVAAYFQLGQLKAELGDIESSQSWLEKGIEVAEQVGDQHALGEMQDFLDQL